MAKFVTKRSFQNIQIWTRVLIMKVLEVLYSSIYQLFCDIHARIYIEGSGGGYHPFGKFKIY